MSKNRDRKDVGGVEATRGNKQVDPTAGVGSIRSVDPTSGVGGIGAASTPGRRRKPTRLLTTEDREQLLDMIQEESAKLFGSSVGITPERRKVVEEAVRMAVESGLREPTDYDEEKDS